MKKQLSKEERKNRIIARGEHSNHSHIVVGDCTVTRNAKGEVIVEVGKEGAVLKHLMESDFVEGGREQWTGEHTDIALEQGTYKYIQQLEYNPYSKAIEAVKD